MFIMKFQSIIEEIRRRRLSWFGHISRMEIDRLQPELFIAMLLENTAKEDKQKVDGKHQGRLRTTEYTI